MSGLRRARPVPRALAPACRALRRRRRRGAAAWASLLLAVAALRLRRGRGRALPRRRVLPSPPLPFAPPTTQVTPATPSAASAATATIRVSVSVPVVVHGRRRPRGRVAVSVNRHDARRAGCGHNTRERGPQRQRILGIVLADSDELCAAPDWRTRIVVVRSPPPLLRPVAVAPAARVPPRLRSRP